MSSLRAPTPTRPTPGTTLLCAGWWVSNWQSRGILTKEEWVARVERLLTGDWDDEEMERLFSVITENVRNSRRDSGISAPRTA